MRTAGEDYKLIETQCPFCTTIIDIDKVIIITCDACLERGYPDTRGEFIYMVIGCYGDIAQSWRINIKAFLEPLQAIEYARKYQRVANKIVAFLKEIDKKMDEFREIEREIKGDPDVPENLWVLWDKYCSKEEEFNGCIVQPVKLSK